MQRCGCDELLPGGTLRCHLASTAVLPAAVLSSLCYELRLACNDAAAARGQRCSRQQVCALGQSAEAEPCCQQRRCERVKLDPITRVVKIKWRCSSTVNFNCKPTTT
jgi:hypothetical protein